MIDSAGPLHRATRGPPPPLRGGGWGALILPCEAGEGDRPKGGGGGTLTLPGKAPLCR
jgi:hypothetical protein